jgi:hypothetical protein
VSEGAGSGEQEAASLIEAAEKLIEPLRKALDRYKWAMRTGAAVLVTLIGVIIVLGIVAISQHGQDVQLARESAAQQQQTTALCETGNTFREGEQGIWDKLFAISYGAQPPTPQTRRLVDEFLAYVTQVDKLHNCKAPVR